MKKFIVIALMVMVCPALAHASVTLNGSFGQFFGSDGSSPLPVGSSVALFADADRDGFGNIIMGFNSIMSSDADDLFLAYFATNDGLGVEGTAFESILFDYTGLQSGDPLTLIWSDKSFDGSGLTAGQTVNYGIYRTDNETMFSIPYLVPADGATVDFAFLTESLAGPDGVANNLGTANFQTQVVPEPVSAVLALLGGAAMFVRRRFFA